MQIPRSVTKCLHVPQCIRAILHCSRTIDLMLEKWRRISGLILSITEGKFLTAKLIVTIYKGKGKAHPLQAMQAQRDLGELRLLDFLTSALYGGRFSASRTGRLYSQGHPWYSFSRRAESTPGPWFSRKEICHWKIQWHDRESIPGRNDIYHHNQLSRSIQKPKIISSLRQSNYWAKVSLALTLKTWILCKDFINRTCMAVMPKTELTVWSL
jgi:hypothetical protein